MKICIKCNNRVQDSKNFCDNCGGNRFRPVPNAQPQQQPQRQPQQQQRQVRPNTQSTQNIQREQATNIQQPVRPQQQQPQFSQTYEDTTNRYADTPQTEDTTVAEWIKILIFTIIPIFNIIYIIKNIKNNNIPSYKSNYFKAYGIYFLVASAVSLILSILL